MVIGGTVNLYSYITVRRLPPYHPYKSRFVYSETETVQSNAEVKHRVIKAVLDYLEVDFGVEFFHASDLPSRSGMGSSSSFLVGTINAVSTLIGKHLAIAELARAAIHIEQMVLNETVGYQDSTFAAHGGFCQHRYTYAPDKKHHIYPVPLDSTSLRDFESHLLLYFTGQTRTASDVAASYVPTLAMNAAPTLKIVRLAEEAHKLLLAKDWLGIGRILDESWQLKRSLSAKVSNTAIDDIYARARVSGAWGGKLLGAGGGGCVLLIVPPERQERVKHQLRDLVSVVFRFERSGDCGSRIIYHTED